ncbi:MAG: archaetidylserine decarboxylase [Myxococcota bacterium]
MSKTQTEPEQLHGIARALLGLLVLLPKNAISRAMGWLASRRLPGPLQRPLLALFVRLAGVDRRELARPLASYDSLQSFFTRALPPGARPLEGGEDVLVSPCDGAWGASGRIEGGTILQVKGRPYRVADLLGSEEAARPFEGGTFATLYLSPRDYHRFHAPTAGRITRLVYRPGNLWPVNAIGLLGVEGVFARNERICAWLEIEPGTGTGTGISTRIGDGVAGEPTSMAGDTAAAGQGAAAHSIAMIAVGATMVGSVRLAFDGLRTNRAGAVAVDRALGALGPKLARGEEWGHFEFGSTIVLLIPPGLFTLDAQAIGTPLRLGRAIGRRTNLEIR